MDMGGSVSLADLMDELEHYLGVHLQSKEAKRELLSIKQQPTEPVTEYHQRLQRLWHRARTNEDERIEKFKVTMLPSLSSSLLARNYTRVRDLLDDQNGSHVQIRVMLLWYLCVDTAPCEFNFRRPLRTHAAQHTTSRLNSRLTYQERLWGSTPH